MGVPVKKTSGKKKPSRAQPQLTAEEHFENAEMAFAMDNTDLARSNFKRALAMEPENIEYLEGFGSFLAECGPRQEAVQVLQRAVQLQPEEGFEKYMYLGQLLEEPEAEQCVRKGITLLRAYIQQEAQEPAAAEGSEEAAEQAESKAHLAATLASCLCSLAEVLLNKAEAGDAGIGEVEAECEELLSEGRTLAPHSPEPLQALASLRQQQGKDEEALDLLRHSVSLWFKPSPDTSDDEDAAAELKAKAAETAAAAGKDAEEEDLGSQGSDSEMEDDIEDELPSFEFRFEAAKLLLELDDSVNMACQVLEQLLDENDQDPNVWLLLAMCCQGGGDLEGALEAVEEGIALCKKLGVPADHATLAGFEAMQTELQSMLESVKKDAKEGEAKQVAQQPKE